MYTEICQKYVLKYVQTYAEILENVEDCVGEPEQAANMHMNRLSFTLK